jgi:uncharacterized membrane protein AbrB (regulator of aidB expression)
VLWLGWLAGWPHWLVGWPGWLVGSLVGSQGSVVALEENRAAAPRCLVSWLFGYVGGCLVCALVGTKMVKKSNVKIVAIENFLIFFELFGY